MADPPTARDYVNVHRVDAVCRDPMCDHIQELDLAGGQGDVPLIHCHCGAARAAALGHQIKVSGQSYGLAE
jgi:hypothetical protein